MQPMTFRSLALVAFLVPAPLLADGHSAALDFVTQNRLDQNLYNLLAATIPSTEAGQALFKVCGEVKMEILFQNAYETLQDQMGDVWRNALADVYARHVTPEDMEALTAIENTAQRQEAIAARLTQDPVVDDLRTTLSPLVSEAVGRHGNMMIDEAETLCPVG